MARNEEKQQGKLNRLWLQKEREEGRIKDIHERRPKLSTLNSASAVKKWIPSIKNEIEYYLQQSQLSHYPDRKIAEFQLCIEGLESEYKRFLCKLRALDPSCKHRPWTPRAYAKRRADPPTSTSYAKKPHVVSSRDPSGSSPPAEAQSDRTASDGTAAARERQDSLRRAEPRHGPANHSPADQDQPLAFDRTRLAVAVAGSRGPARPGGSSPTQSLARVLLSGLPNLHSSPLGQALAAQARDAASTGGEGGEGEEVKRGGGGRAAGHRLGTEGDSASAGEERAGTAARSHGDGRESPAHILGLGCYSSSDEELDA